MRLLLCALWLLLVGLACSPSSPAVECDGGACLESPVQAASATKQALSGSRLSVRYVEAEDGAKVFDGFWDKERKEACAFLSPAVLTKGAVASEKRYCLPSSFPLFFFESVFFVDASCQKRAVATSCPPLPAPAYIVTPEAPAVCAATPSRCHVAGQRQPLASRLYVLEGGQCVETFSSLLTRNSHQIRLDTPCSESMFSGYVAGVLSGQ